jgi:bifunctional non-homologous end joining protein LigD
VNSVTIKKRVIQITNPDKLIFKHPSVSKKQLIGYYYAIAPVILPHLKSYPLSFRRFPDGVDQEGFYQKNAADYFPEWIKTVSVATRSGHVNHTLCNDAATLVYLANQACVEIHRHLSTAHNLHKPQHLVFDLDPSPKNSFSDVCCGAYIIKKIIEQCNLNCFVMTTGSRGLHVVIPLQPRYTFDQVETVAQYITSLAEKKSPSLLTQEIRKAKRGNRVFIDTMRNAYNAMAVAPYSVRARPNAPVAAPVLWEALEGSVPSSDHYTIFSIIKKLEKEPDPWHTIREYASSLGRLEKKIKSLPLFKGHRT